MLFFKTITFRTHIAYLFLLIGPCNAADFNNSRHINSADNFFTDSMYDPNHCSFSLEPIEIDKNIPSNNAISDAPILSKDNFPFDMHSIAEQQLNSSSINSFQDFQPTSMIQYTAPLDDTISLCQTSSWGNSLHNDTPLATPFNKLYQPFQDNTLHNDLNSVSLETPSPFPIHLDNASLRAPSPFPNIGVVGWLNQLPSLPTVNEENQSSSPQFTQQNRELHNPIMIPPSKKKSKKKKKIVKEKSKSVKHKTKNPKKYACQYCNQKFARNYNRNVHERTHTNPKPFQCKECGKRLSRKACLQKHMLIHTREVYPCNYCDKIYTTKKGLIRHERDHTGEKPFVCKFCNKAFKKKENCISHTNQVHLNKRPFPCQICKKKSFKRKEHLQKHHKSCKG